MQSWSITHKGAVRPDNQDTVLSICDERNGLAFLVVCDGMGGARAGGLASRMALKQLKSEMYHSLTGIPTEEEAKNAFSEAVAKVNRVIYEKSQNEEGCRGMGTTMVAAVVTGDCCVILNVGDSRAYHISPGRIHQVTVDHSVMEEMVRGGQLTREQARHSSGRNLITRAIGTMENVEEDIFSIRLLEGEWLLLCSDGLSNIISDEEILQILQDCGDGKSVEVLLQLALKRGAPDNVSAVLLKK